ncbi:hypothetical protein XENORESO_015134 [Xenotaenia resolanae]|uniref:Uncharacterized protein n=1 Tax=Xenotaenia resolanae TaxID=208358 RepID=A0ABV0WK46_9TELE
MMTLTDHIALPPCPKHACILPPGSCSTRHLRAFYPPGCELAPLCERRAEQRGQKQMSRIHPEGEPGSEMRKDSLDPTHHHKQLPEAQRLLQPHPQNEAPHREQKERSCRTSLHLSQLKKTSVAEDVKQVRHPKKISKGKRKERPLVWLQR